MFLVARYRIYKWNRFFCFFLKKEGELIGSWILRVKEQEWLLNKAESKGSCHQDPVSPQSCWLCFPLYCFHPQEVTPIMVTVKRIIWLPTASHLHSFLLNQSKIEGLLSPNRLNKRPGSWIHWPKQGHMPMPKSVPMVTKMWVILTGSGHLPNSATSRQH